MSLMVELEDAIAEEELIARLGVSAARTSDGATIYVGDQDDSDAFYWKESDDQLVSQFAIGSVPRISEVAAVEGARSRCPVVPIALGRLQRRVGVGRTGHA